MKIKRALLFLTFLTTCILNTKSQPGATLSGKLKDQKSNKLVAFATIIVLDTKDSSMIKGTTSNLHGDFTIKNLHKDTYLLKIQHMSYKTLIKKIVTEANATINLGTIFLGESAINMNEIVIISNRIKAKEEDGKTIFFMNKQLVKASHTGYDALCQLPGMQADIFKNISYNGNENVKIFVNDNERDIEYLGQLNASDIKKIEIINSPGSQYKSNTGAVINIVMKKKKESFSGSVYSEIPTSKSTVYLFPNYGFNYNYEKVSLHTSYNGEISNFDIIKKRVHSFENDVRNKTFSLHHNVRQKNWSHRFNFDVDYKINKQNLINIYGFYNPFSQEHDGLVKATSAHESIGQTGWNAKKEDTDKNNVIYGSFFYKHLLKKGGNVCFKLKIYSLNAKNNTKYRVTNYPKPQPGDLTGATSHLQKTGTIKMDYNSPEILDKLKLNAGVIHNNKSVNNQLNNLDHRNNILAFYGITHYGLKHLNLELGYRIEKTFSNIKAQYSDKDLVFLPAVQIGYKFTKNQNIRFSYKHYYIRPTVYQLNPALNLYGLLERHYGNMDLKNEMHRKCYVDHSISSGGDYFSYRLFYETFFNKINYATYLNDMNFLESVYINSGKIDYYGMQLNGSFKLSKVITMAKFFKLGNYNISPNNNAKNFGSTNKTKLAFESSLSAIITFQHNITASLKFQYNSPKPMLQGTIYSDPLYFVSLEKNFKKHIKIGITMANPFMKSITYYGNNRTGRDFCSNNKEMISTSGFPLWFKISYSFTKGIKNGFSKQKQVNIEKRRKKGF